MTKPFTLLAALFFSTFSSSVFSQNDPCDTVLVVAEATGGTITCAVPFDTLSGLMHPSALSFQWSGPNGFASNDREVVAHIPGSYILTVTGALGCTAEDTVALMDVCSTVAGVPMNCSTGMLPADICGDVCTSCSFSAYSGTTAGYTGDSGTSFCGTIENNQWFAYVAGSSVATFTATPSNCTDGNGIQLALYQDCSSNWIACNIGGAGWGNTPVSITTTLIPGQLYYLMLDGYAGDQCDFTLNIVPPNAVVPPPVATPASVIGPSSVCSGELVAYQISPSVTNAPYYLWTAPSGATVNGLLSPALLQTSLSSAGIVFGSEGGQVCVRSVSPCQGVSAPACLSVSIIEPLPVTTLPDVTVCAEDAPYVLPWGETVFVSGTYQTSLTSAMGCDSVVRQKVVIKTHIITNLPPRVICAGSCVTICGEEYCNLGNYSAVCTSYQGCDSVVNFSILVLDPVVNVTTNGVLSCANPSIVLTATSGPQAAIVWKNSDGEVLATGNSLTVTQPGIYVAMATQSAGGVSCSKSDTIAIVADSSQLPLAFAQGGMLTCINSSTTLAGSSDNPDATFSWSGPGGFFSNEQNPTAQIPGTYVLTVTIPNGCTATATAEVTADPQAPTVSAAGGSLTCTVAAVTLSASSDSSNVTYHWEGPNGFTSDIQNPIVSEIGVYFVTVTAPNGCQGVAAAIVALDIQEPNVTAIGGTLTCVVTDLVLNALSDIPNVTYHWTGPNGFSSDLQNPSVSQPGTYMVMVTAPNGCQSAATVDVTQDIQPPDAVAVGGTINCAVTSIVLSCGFSPPGAICIWSPLPPGIPDPMNPIVGEPGVYTLTVIAQNGCSDTDEAVVDIDTIPPDVTATGGILTCAQPVTTISGSSTTPGVTFLWTGPDGTNFPLPNPSVSEPGVYMLLVTAPNGCAASTTVTVIDSCILWANELLVPLDELLKVYPNVSTDIVFVEIPGSATPIEAVRVFDAIGGLLLEEKYIEAAAKRQLDLSGTASGFYWVAALVKGKWVVKPLVVGRN